MQARETYQHKQALHKPKGSMKMPWPGVLRTFLKSTLSFVRSPDKNRLIVKACSPF